jgi:hypothetical protein
MNLKMNNLKLTRFIFISLLAFTHLAVFAQSSAQVEKLLETAKKQLAVKNYNEALKSCNQALTLDEKSKDAYVLMSQIYGEMNEIDQEILYLNKAGKVGNDWDVVFRLGEAYYKKGNYSEALRYYNIYSDLPLMPEKRQFLLACKIASCKFSMNPQTSDKNYWPVPTNDGNNLVFVSSDSNQEQELNIPETELWNIYKSSSDTIPFDNTGVHKLSDGSRILFFTA